MTNENDNVLAIKEINGWIDYVINILNSCKIYNQRLSALSVEPEKRSCESCRIREPMGYCIKRVEEKCDEISLKCWTPKLDSREPERSCKTCRDKRTADDHYPCSECRDYCYWHEKFKPIDPANTAINFTDTPITGDKQVDSYSFSSPEEQEAHFELTSSVGSRQIKQLLEKGYIGKDPLEPDKHFDIEQTTIPEVDIYFSGKTDIVEKADKIKRYRQDADYCLMETDNGDWVYYDDHLEAIASLEARIKELETEPIVSSNEVVLFAKVKQLEAELKLHKDRWEALGKWLIKQSDSTDDDVSRTFDFVLEYKNKHELESERKE